MSVTVSAVVEHYDSAPVLEGFPERTVLRHGLGRDGYWISLRTGNLTTYVTLREQEIKLASFGPSAFIRLLEAKCRWLRMLHRAWLETLEHMLPC